MRKLIAAINMSVDGYCDHTIFDPDETMHNYYTDLLGKAGVLLYGRVTYQLMEFWKEMLEHPSGVASMDTFAQAIDRVPKIVFSTTLKETGWTSATLAKRALTEEVLALKQEAGNDIFVGSPGLISTLSEHNLIDEYQLCVLPVIAAGGQRLFKNNNTLKKLKLVKAQAHSFGGVILTYHPAETAPV